MIHVLPQLIKEPFGPGSDSHHTDTPMRASDARLGDYLSTYIGSLHIDASCSSVDEWSRIVRALRIHGLMIVEEPLALALFARQERQVMSAKDDKINLSIRFIRQYDPAHNRWFNAMEAALVSCASLGHTWRINGATEEFCGVCGCPNPNFAPRASRKDTPQP